MMIQSQTLSVHGSSASVTSAATVCLPRMRTYLTGISGQNWRGLGSPCPVIRRPLPEGLTITRLFLRGYHTDLGIGADGDTGITVGCCSPDTRSTLFFSLFVAVKIRFDSGRADISSTRGSVTAAGATSTAGHTRQANLDQHGYAAAHGSQQQHAAAPSRSQQEGPSGVAESKPPVEDVLLGIGAQFDAFHGGCY